MASATLIRPVTFHWSRDSRPSWHVCACVRTPLACLPGRRMSRVRLTAVHPFCEKFAAAGPVQYLNFARCVACMWGCQASQFLAHGRRAAQPATRCFSLFAHARRAAKNNCSAHCLSGCACIRACVMAGDAVRAMQCTAMQARHTMPVSLHVHASERRAVDCCNVYCNVDRGRL